MATIRVNDYDMVFVASGAGIPLLLIHGTASDYRLWAGQTAPFGTRFRTIAVSLRHYWTERWDGEGDGFSSDQHVLDVAAFISALHAGPVHLLGLSRGGGIAFRVAREHPDLVRGLILVEPGLSLDASLEPPHPPVTAPLSFVGM